jgi:amino acid ABC transporter ATP-binding protein, PAAT family (TC 3.A.1.3.-)
MVVVTHEIGFARNVATRIVYMENGVIIEEGNPVDFFTCPHTTNVRDFLSSVYT